MLRTKELATFDRDPITNDHCLRCKKDLKPGQSRRWVHCIEGGTTVLHPGDEKAYVPDGGDMGSFPLGMDCARRLGLEWSTP